MDIEEGYGFIGSIVGGAYDYDKPWKNFDMTKRKRMGEGSDLGGAVYSDDFPKGLPPDWERKFPWNRDLLAVVKLRDRIQEELDEAPNKKSLRVSNPIAFKQQEAHKQKLREDLAQVETNLRTQNW